MKLKQSLVTSLFLAITLSTSWGLQAESTKSTLSDKKNNQAKSQLHVIDASKNKTNPRLRTNPPRTKKPIGCKVFENAIRNIRTVKEMQRELSNFDEETIKKCIVKFRRDPRIIKLFEQWSELQK